MASARKTERKKNLKKNETKHLHFKCTSGKQGKKPYNNEKQKELFVWGQKKQVGQSEMD